MQVDLNELLKQQCEYINGAILPATFEKERCIVTTCYDQEFAGCCILLTELIRLQTSLPILVYYRVGELTEQQIAFLSEISTQIEIRQLKNDIKNFVDRYGHSKGWACKIYAVLESTDYEQVLWLDNDSIPIRNPDFLFDDPEYQTKGSLFWRDLMSTDQANDYCWTSDFWRVFNVAPNDSELFDSGQFLINKTKCWQELQLMKCYADRNQVYFNWGGDKECWRMAWQHLHLRRGRSFNQLNFQIGDVPYGMIEWGPFMKGNPNPYKKWSGGSIMVQRDRQGQELFNHRTMAKFRLNQTNDWHTGIQNEAWYHSHLQILENKWKTAQK